MGPLVSLCSTTGSLPSFRRNVSGRAGMQHGWALREGMRLLAAPRAQMAKSLYSGRTVSVGGSNMPAATVRFVPGSMRMNEPVRRLPS